MNLEKFRLHCLGKNGATEDFPFDETTLVFRIAGKIFAMTDVEGIPLSFNLKCDPERSVELREAYSCITPGYHMDKKHWLTVKPDGSISDKLIYELIDHSYNLVVQKLKKTDKEKLLKALRV